MTKTNTEFTTQTENEDLLSIECNVAGCEIKTHWVLSDETCVQLTHEGPCLWASQPGSFTVTAVKADGELWVVEVSSSKFGAFTVESAHAFATAIQGISEWCEARNLSYEKVAA